MYKQVLIPALAAASIFVSVPALSAEIYRWVDGNGQTHYSDVPRDGAEQVEVSPAQTFSAPAIARAAPSAAKAAESVAPYNEFRIVSPTEEETIWNTGGVITVSVSPGSTLKPGHSYRIYYDGQQVGTSTPRATSVELSEVVRGEHQISAEIVDSSGQVLRKADPVTFFYKQRSLQNQPRPIPPPPAPAPAPAPTN